MIIQTVSFRSTLPEKELMRVAEERAPKFRAIPGLIQKYYVRGQGEGQYKGIYLWDSMESLAEYRASELAKTIAEAYQVAEPPVVEVGELMFPLRG